MKIDEDISERAVSDWGKRIRELRELGWSYREIAREAKTAAPRIHQMVTDPNYEPAYSMGMRVRKLHLRAILAHRKVIRLRSESVTTKVA